MNKNKKWLVTGGAGFFGIHMCHFLANNGIDVISIDKEEFPNDLLIKNITHINLNILEYDKFYNILIENNVEFIVHAAAELALADPEKILETNGESTKHLLDIFFKASIKRIIYISSCAVYGKPESHPIFENANIFPMGNYGIAKRISENYLLQCTNIETIIIRPKSFIGVGRLGIFQLFFQWIDEGRRIPIFGNGNNKFQLLEVTDLANATYLAMLNGKDKEVYNIGATKFGTVNSDLNLLLTHANTGSKLIHFPSKPLKFILSILEKLHISPIYKWVYDTADQDSYVSTEKAQKDLGWTPKFSNVETLINTYDWYLKEGKIMSKNIGTGHRVAWSQGVLKYIKYLF